MFSIKDAESAGMYYSSQCSLLDLFMFQWLAYKLRTLSESNIQFGTSEVSYEAVNDF